MSEQYTEKQIQELPILEGIRTRLPMYAGSKDAAAITHIVFEIINNSIDEAISGYGSKIEIELNTKTNNVRVRDFARGIPLGSLEGVLTKLHAGGKFNQESGAYKGVGGQNGAGLKLAPATGEVTAVSYREGQKRTIQCNVKGVSKNELSKTKEVNGTEISWTPDREVFTETFLEVEGIKKRLDDMSYLMPGIEFEVTVDGIKESFKSKGLSQFINDYTVEKDRITPVFNFKAETQNLSVEVAMVWTKRENFEKAYTNMIYNSQGGTHTTALKATITREFNKFFETSFGGEEIRRGLCFIISLSMAEIPVFSGQSKERLNHSSINGNLSGLFKDEIKSIFNSAPKEFEAIVKLLTKLNDATDVDKLMKNITAASKKKSSSLFNVSTKFKGCSSDRDIEIFLTEGESASGGLSLTRNPVNQSTYALRGKPLNTFSKELVDILKNEEIQDLIKILGEPKDAIKKFDKIILAADADVDGTQIINLLLGFFAKFYKVLLLEGKIYIPTLPMYMASSPKGEVKFLMNDEEKKKIPSTWDISYLKGLGELSPSELDNFTTNRKTRKLKQVKLTEETYEEFYESLKLALSKAEEDLAMRREMFI